MHGCRERWVFKFQGRSQKGRVDHKRRVIAGDLAAAVSTVKQLDGTAKTAASTWFSSAMARLSAEQSLASLHAHAVAMLSAVKG